MVDAVLFDRNLLSLVCSTLDWSALHCLRGCCRFLRKEVVNMKGYVMNICWCNKYTGKNWSLSKSHWWDNNYNIDSKIDDFIRNIRTPNANVHAELVTGKTGHLENKLFVNGLQIYPINITGAVILELNRYKSCDEELPYDYDRLKPKLSELTFSPNCRVLNLDTLTHLGWKYLLHFGNKCHFLSLRYFAIWKPLPMPPRVSHASFEELPEFPPSVVNFMTENFGVEDSMLFLSYNGVQNYIYSHSGNNNLPCITLDKPLDNDQYDVLLANNGLRIDLAGISKLPAGDKIRESFVRMIKCKIQKYKKKLSNWRSILKWFQTAQIDIIDLSGTNVNEAIVSCLTYCKVIILNNVKNISEEFIQEFITKNPNIVVVHKTKDEDEDEEDDMEDD